MLRQFPVRYEFVARVVSAIAFGAMLGAIFWRASMISAATDIPPRHPGHGLAGESQPASYSRAKSFAEILMGPRNNPEGSAHSAQR